MPNHLYRSKPVTTKFCVALKAETDDGHTGYIVQESDHNGKPTSSKVITVQADKFEESFEPVKRQSKKHKIEGDKTA
jgi:hypothetical protein